MASDWAKESAEQACYHAGIYLSEGTLELLEKRVIAALREAEARGYSRALDDAQALLNRKLAEWQQSGGKDERVD
jgi:hypothetical protein